MKKLSLLFVFVCFSTIMLLAQTQNSIVDSYINFLGLTCGDKIEKANSIFGTPTKETAETEKDWGENKYKLSDLTEITVWYEKLFIVQIRVWHDGTFQELPSKISDPKLNFFKMTESEISGKIGKYSGSRQGWDAVFYNYDSNDLTQLILLVHKDRGCQAISVRWFDCGNKEEKRMFLAIKTIKDCDNYSLKYPNGKWKDDVLKKKTEFQENAKKEQLAKEREQKIKANSNIAIWQIGYKVCRVYNNGYILGSLEQWNGDKSRVQIKIAASPGGLNSEGEKLTKGNTIWINPKEGWHLALDDEKEYALNNDKSDEFEQFQKQLSSNAQNTKKGKFDLGTTVYYKTSSWFLNYKTGSYTIKATVEQWNSSFTKMQVKITDTNYFEGTIDGQKIYNGSLIWVSPYSWE